MNVNSCLNKGEVSLPNFSITEKFPNEMLCLVLSNLSTPEMGAARTVSKR